MRQSRLSGSVEGVMGNHDSYSDSPSPWLFALPKSTRAWAHSLGDRKFHSEEQVPIETATPSATCYIPTTQIRPRNDTGDGVLQGGLA